MYQGFESAGTLWRALGPDSTNLSSRKPVEDLDADVCERVASRSKGGRKPAAYLTDTCLLRPLRR